MATSHQFQLESNGIEESVGIFQTAAESRRAFARLNAPASMACLRRNARRRMGEQMGGPASRLRLLRVEPLGQWGRATRFTATAPSQVGIVRGWIDAVHIRVGRGIGALVIVSGPSPLDEQLYDDVVATSARRLRASLD